MGRDVRLAAVGLEMVSVLKSKEKMKKCPFSIIFSSSSSIISQNQDEKDNKS